MRTNTSVAILGILSLLVLAGTSSAMISFRHTSPEQAKEMGIIVTPKASGPDHVLIDIEFNPEGRLKNFADEKGMTRVDLKIGENKDRLLSASLREDRSKPGKVAVRFVVRRSQLDQVTVWLIDYSGRGGTAEVLRLHEFVNLDKVDTKKKKAPKLKATDAGAPAAALEKAEK